jgi:hypothetical protein
LVFILPIAPFVGFGEVELRYFFFFKLFFFPFFTGFEILADPALLGVATTD